MGLTGSGVRETDAPRGARLSQRPGSGRAGGGARRSGAARSRPASGINGVVLLATAPAPETGVAALLPWGEGTVLGRLLSQLADLGVTEIHVITRPYWVDHLRPTLDALPPSESSVELHSSGGTADDLRVVAALARAGHGGMVVAYADIVTHREALAGLLADPRVSSGILSTTRRVVGRPFAFRTRSNRGRVVSAASPYHSVRSPNSTFLGVLKVSSSQRADLAEIADRLTELTTPPLPDSWQEELGVKESTWRLSLSAAELRAARAESGASAESLESLEDEEEESADPDGLELDALETEVEIPDTVTLSPEDEAEVGRWRAAAPQDAASLLVVGLVRSGAHVGVSHLRKLFWARPLSRSAAQQASLEIADYDEDRELLNSAVKANDGFFTTFFVSPYSKYLARWAARRGLTPNQVTAASLCIGLLAAAAFATGGRAGLVAGAVLLQLSFTTDCVDGQLARYTRTFTSLGAWLDSIFDRTKEYAIFAGLAIGASRTGSSVWLLAGCALALQTVRHAIDFSYPAVQHQMLGSARQQPLERPSDSDEKVRPPALATTDAVVPPPAAPLPRRALRVGFSLWRLLDRRRGVRWVKKIIVFPIGERFAVISLTAAVATPRVTFIVLLAWGGAAVCYVAAGRVLRSVSR